MKKVRLRVLTRVNVLLGAVLALFGLGCGGCAEKYGSPYATYQYEGSVTNEQQQPLKDIRVTIKAPKYDNEPIVSPVFTEEDGRFRGTAWDMTTLDTLNVVFTDTTQVYREDSTQVVVKWEKSKEEWCVGECEFEVNMQLKKNTEDTK